MKIFYTLVSTVAVINNSIDVSSQFDCLPNGACTSYESFYGGPHPLARIRTFDSPRKRSPAKHHDLPSHSDTLPTSLHTSPAELSSQNERALVFRRLSIPASLGLYIRFIKPKFKRILPNNVLPAVLDKDGEVVGIMEDKKLRGLYDPSKSYRVIYRTKENDFIKIRPSQQKTFYGGLKLNFINDKIST
ncbi:uncharacterized protein LOC117177314 [Belonocnema kinseyi]|uniref:uncharacterized protein LOC117177314 n=1 Tax=Belonocnema kinseyi TaxID=2817044 RepID=UPI00143DC2E7|nr:uncharacterized protein LOC117177314 [Belonocnema kinseyi]